MAKTGYVWDGTQFVSISSPIAAVPNAVVTYNSIAPTSPKLGQLWLDSSSMITYVYNGSAWVMASGSLPIDLNINTITSDYNIPVGSNGLSAGPITIGSGTTTTINLNSTWSII